MGAKVSDEVEARMATKKLGDEQSSLLDNFERLSVEAHLHSAMRLGRSRSEPGAIWRKATPRTALDNLPAQTVAGLEGREALKGLRPRRRSSAALRNTLKRLFGPIAAGFRRREKKEKEVKDPRFLKDFSRSMRF